MFFWPEVVWILSPSLWPQSHWACKHMTGYPWLMEIYLEHFFFYKCVASTFRTNIVWLLLMNFQGNNLLKSQFLMWLNPVVKAHMYLVICIINRWHFNVCISIYRTTFFPTNGSNAPALFGSNFGEFPCTNHLRRIYSKHCVPTYYPCTTHVLQSRTIR